MLAKLFTAEQMPGVRWEDLREPTGSTVERAVIGGARADRLGYAFAIGYSTALDRKTHAFAFHIGADEKLYAQDAFAEPPQTYPKADDLARRITELLFGA